MLKHLNHLNQKYKHLRTIALNPFETEQIVLKFSEAMNLEFGCDRQGTYIYNEISKYPSLLLITESGKTIIRQEGIKQFCLSKLEAEIKLRSRQQG